MDRGCVLYAGNLQQKKRNDFKRVRCAMNCVKLCLKRETCCVLFNLDNKILMGVRAFDVQKDKKRSSLEVLSALQIGLTVHLVHY